jgi:hypothetical protein
LGELLGKTGGHLGGVRIDDVALIITLDRRPCHRHDVRDFYQPLNFVIVERNVIDARMSNETAPTAFASSSRI